MTPPNKDHISPPVLSGGSVGLVVAIAVRSVIDRYVDPADRELWWNLAQAALFLLPLVGGWLGGLRAKRDVTPITPGAVPRDAEGRVLVPSLAFPTRAARPEERPRRNLVDPP